MTRKRYIKLLMGDGVSPRTAHAMAKAKKHPGGNYKFAWSYHKAMMQRFDARLENEAKGEKK